jgi:hypothetical protein
MTDQQQYRPSLGENPIVAMLIPHLVPWSYQSMIHTWLYRVYVGPRTTIAIVAALAITGLVIGSIALPPQVTEKAAQAFSGLRSLYYGSP